MFKKKQNSLGDLKDFQDNGGKVQNNANDKSKVLARKKHLENSKKELEKLISAGKVESKNVGKNKKVAQDNKIVVKIKNLSELLGHVKDEQAVEILKYLESKNCSIDVKEISRTFKSEDEIKQFLRNEITNFLDNRCEDLKGKISQLRKKGRDISDVDFRLMSIPLKIRMFAVDFNKKDFDKIMSALGTIEAEVQKGLQELEIEMKEKEAKKVEEEKRRAEEQKKKQVSKKIEQKVVEKPKLGEKKQVNKRELIKVKKPAGTVSKTKKK